MEGGNRRVEHIEISGSQIHQVLYDCRPPSLHHEYQSVCPLRKCIRAGGGLLESRYPHSFARLLTLSLFHVMERHSFDRIQVWVIFKYLAISYIHLRDHGTLLHLCAT